LARPHASRADDGARATGHRTLGVITKIDLMDKGTDALAVLLGKVGFVRAPTQGRELRGRFLTAAICRAGYSAEARLRGCGQPKPGRHQQVREHTQPPRTAELN
jgi:hypothetical protein